MEMYTWGDETVKVILSARELAENNIDTTNGLIDDHAEIYFASLLRTVATHHDMKPSLYLDAEVIEKENGAIVMNIQFVDEEGVRKEVCQASRQKYKGLLFRFSDRSDLIAMADRADKQYLSGGTLWEWDTFYYLHMDPHPGKSHHFLSALLGEYGERACIHPEVVKARGKLLEQTSAIERLASRQI